MSPSMLQALRRLLFFSRPEAALLIAASQDRPSGVSDRAWRMWEDGDRPIPVDVALRIGQLIEWRTAAIDAAIKQIISGPDGAVINLIWYESIDDWSSVNGREPVLWRAQQSVAAALVSEFNGRVRLVRFDGPIYSEWLNGRGDTETTRAMWAASTTCD